jgi:signal transduction histidine kinase
LIGSLRAAVAPVAAAKSVGFTADWSTDTGTIDVDRDQLDRALLNLLTNAVKFTPAGGQVSLTARRSGDDLVVTVSDTGLGIPVEEQDQLFTRFFRSTVANKMAIQGTGLGLVIVKEIVEQHGGTVTVESSAGLGTTVTVRLPAADVTEPQPGAA